MAQLNTKILHHGMPRQISQTFSEGPNGEGWSKQALSSHPIKTATRQRTILKPLTVSLRQKISESWKIKAEGPKMPIQNLVGSQSGNRRAAPSSVRSFPTAEAKSRRKRFRGERMEGFERETWALLLQLLARRDRAG